MLTQSEKESKPNNDTPFGLAKAYSRVDFHLCQWPSCKLLAVAFIKRGVRFERFNYITGLGGHGIGQKYLEPGYHAVCKKHRRELVELPSFTRVDWQPVRKVTVL